MEILESRVKKGGGKYCSHSCKRKHLNKLNPYPSEETRQKISKNHADVSGKNNPMYGRRNFLSPGFIDGRNQFKGETYRRKALANLPHECVLCDETDLNRLHVHHKDGNRKNNDLDNLAILCVNCHNNKAHIYLRDEKGRFITSIKGEEL